MSVLAALLLALSGASQAATVRGPSGPAVPGAGAVPSLSVPVGQAQPGAASAPEVPVLPEALPETAVQDIGKAAPLPAAPAAVKGPLLPAVSPGLLPVSAPAAPEQASPAAQLGAAARESAVAASGEGAGTGGDGFDGSVPGGPGGLGGGDAPPGGEPAPEALDLRFTRDFKKRLMTSQIFGSVRLLTTAGQKWHWERFKEGAPVRVLAGGQTAFLTRVEDGLTKPIGTLTKKDLVGVYSARYLRETPIAKVRKRLINDLTSYQNYGRSAAATVVTPRSEVRVVRVMPWKRAKDLPQNKEESHLEVRPRRPVDVPKALGGVHSRLPKAVLLDMRLLDRPVSFDFIEDLGKLMKAGVYFVLLTDKPREGAGSLEELLTAGLSASERDGFVRHKLIALTDDGNALAAFKGSFPKPVPLGRFTEAEREALAFAARSLGALGVPVSWGTEVTVVLPKGAEAPAFAASLRKALDSLAFDAAYTARPSSHEGRPALTIRPRDLVTAVEPMLAALREHEGLFVEKSDLMVVSRDPALLEATRGALQPSAHAPEGAGEDLLELSMAALLGPYRENLPGDLAASASKIGSFLQGRDSEGGFHYNVYMMMGHVMHSAFNWAVWRYRVEGTFPAVEELVAHALRLWQREEGDQLKNLISGSGESMGGFREVMVARIQTMHRVAAELLEAYPIVIGTELPNLFVFNRFKGSEFLYRDVLRLIYDFVIARETPDGLEVAIVDFKTGQTPTLQNMEKDTQVQLYDHVARAAWKSIPIPYAWGEWKRVAKTKVIFIFPTAAYEPNINEWARIKFEKFLRLVMNRMRRKGGVEIPKPAPVRASRRR